MPAELLEKVSCLRAALVARLIMKKVPAYKEFLKERGVSNKKVKSINDLKSLPLTDKKNYFLKYGIEKTLLEKSLCDSNGWERSSNYDPETLFTLWPRFIEDEKKCLTNFDFSLRYFYGCDNKKTLVVVTFLLGMWAAGERIIEFTKKISRRKELKISVAACGPIRLSIIDLLQRVGKSFDQIILVGSPYFLKRTIEYGEKAGLDWRSLNVGLLTGADGFSENLRNFMLQKIAGEKESEALVVKRMVSVFGLTETNGTFAVETPLTNLIRRLSLKDLKLKKAFFGDVEALPMCFQYNPINTFLEVDNNELIVTRLTKQPLLRFNTQDVGKVCSFKETMSIFEKSGYDIEKLLKAEKYGKNDIFPLPFVFVFGRKKNEFKVQGTAFTIEELQEYFSHPDLIKSNTGNFKVEIIEKNGVERLKLTVELMDNIVPTAELNEQYKENFCNISSTRIQVQGFLKYFDGDIDEIAPIIDLVERGKTPFSNEEQPKYHYLKKA